MRISSPPDFAGLFLSRRGHHRHFTVLFMFSSVLSSGRYALPTPKQSHIHPFQASAFFYPPIDDNPHLGEPSTSTISYSNVRSLSWNNAGESSTDISDDTPTRPLSPVPSRGRHRRHQEIADILEQKDFYNILGLSRAAASDKLELRRAYLSRSRACHPEYVPIPWLFHFRLCVGTLSFSFHMIANFPIILKQRMPFKKFPSRITFFPILPQNVRMIYTMPHMSFLAVPLGPPWALRRR
jgi:hypothetical protein